MSVDWLSLVSTVGGLSGFASLYVTVRWRRQDQLKDEADRLTVDRVTATDYGMAFWIRYAAASEQERLEVEIDVLGPKPRPSIQVKKHGLYDVTTGTVPEVAPYSTTHSVTAPLVKWAGRPALEYAQEFAAICDPTRREAKIRVVIRGAASRKALVRQKLHLSA